MPLNQDDHERFEALKAAMADTYASGPAQPRRKARPFQRKLFWLAIAGCVLVMAAFAGAMIAQWRAATQIQSELTQPQAVPSAFAVVTLPPPPRTPPPTSPPTKAPTATPSPQPSATPSAEPTASPSPSPHASTVAVIHNAFLVVKSNNQINVGAKGSCGGLDRTVKVRGYPIGCTVFDADSTGPLQNGHGTALVVPVSTSEDVGDVKYGLLYVRSKDAEEPRFVGFIRAHGSGRVVVRIQGGRIMAQTDDEVSYYTFNGRRIVPVPE